MEECDGNLYACEYFVYNFSVNWMTMMILWIVGSRGGMECPVLLYV